MNRATVFLWLVVGVLCYVVLPRFLRLSACSRGNLTPDYPVSRNFATLTTVTSRPYHGSGDLFGEIPARVHFGNYLIVQATPDMMASLTSSAALRACSFCMSRFLWYSMVRWLRHSARAICLFV